MRFQLWGPTSATSCLSLASSWGLQWPLPLILVLFFPIINEALRKRRSNSWKRFLFQEKEEEEDMSRKLLNRWRRDFFVKPRKGNREKMKETTAQIWAMQEFSLLYVCVSLSRNVCACAWKPRTVRVGSGSWKHNCRICSSLSLCPTLSL